MEERARAVTVAVTGAAGYIASRFVAAACGDDGVGRVLGFDLVKPRFDHAQFVFDHLDVRDPALERRLAGVDVLVHLAFVMDPIRDEGAMRDVNVNGSENVFRCAARAGVRKIVYTSSATVYGAHADNEIPLTEDAPLRANLDFSYAAHKLEVEYVLKELRTELADAVVTVFRPAIVFGPNVDNAWSHMLELPLLFGVTGHSPPIQFVHEEDVARALHLAALERDLDGAYNVAAEGWLTAERALAIAGKRRIALPEGAAFALLDGLWRAGLAEAPGGILHYLMHPWVVSTTKLAAAGFHPRHGNEETLSQAAARARRYVRMGTRRAERRLVARGLWAAAAAGGLIAGARVARGRR